MDCLHKFCVDPDNPTVPVKIFESAIEVTRCIEGASKSRIKNALNENTLYLGYRWTTVHHDQDENIVTIYSLQK